MLLELWAKVRGAEKKWPEVQAVVRLVQQYDEVPTGRYAYLHDPRKFAEVTFAYVDLQQEHQYGSITVDESSDLFDAKEDDTFTIRVDTNDGTKHYSPEARKTSY
jgi:hypothetical protein